MSIKESDSLLVWLHRLLDILTPMLVLYLSVRFYPPDTDTLQPYINLGLLGGLLFLVFTQGAGLYSNWRGRSLISGFRKILTAWAITWLVMIVLVFLLKMSESFSRIILVAWALSTPILLLLYRMVIRFSLRSANGRGWYQKRVAFVGMGTLGQRLASSMMTSSLLGYEIYGYWDDDADTETTNHMGIPYLGTTEDLLRSNAHLEDIDEIFLTLPLRAESTLKALLDKLSFTTIKVNFAPDLFTFDLLHSRLSDISGIPIFSIYDSPLNNTTARLIKRVEDIGLSVLILALISPLFVVLPILIRLSSPGPVFYKQKRMGWNGQIFHILKFRSMTVSADQEKLQWGRAEDKQQTAIGNFMRKHSLDELPQFLNVLRGDMSIVGPRPERDIFIEEFKRTVPRYMQKHMVKAGITGWAQINGWRGDTSIHKRIEYDLYYIDNWSVWLDIKIILATITRMRSE